MTDLVPGVADVNAAYEPTEGEIDAAIARADREAEAEAREWDRAGLNPPPEIAAEWERAREQRVARLTPFAKRLQRRGWHRRSDQQIRDALHRHLVRRGMDPARADVEAESLLEDLRDLWPARRAGLRLPEDREETEAWAGWVRHQERQAAAARIQRRRGDAARNREAAEAARYRARQAQAAMHAQNQGQRARARRSPASRRGTARRCAGGGGDDGGAGSTGGSDDPEPRPPRHYDHDIFDYGRLAARWAVSPRSLANQFSRLPNSLPPHVNLPASRGPRWLREDVEEFERQQRRVPDQPLRRSRGRPRIVSGGRP